MRSDSASDFTVYMLAKNEQVLRKRLYPLKLGLLTVNFVATEAF